MHVPCVSRVVAKAPSLGVQRTGHCSRRGRIGDEVGVGRHRDRHARAAVRGPHEIEDEVAAPRGRLAAKVPCPSLLSANGWPAT